ADPVTIPADKTEAEVEVSAANSAELGRASATLEARESAEDSARSPRAEAKFELTVLAPPPALRMAVAPEVEVPQGGKGRFRVRIARDHFTGRVEIEPKNKDSLPEGL